MLDDGVGFFPNLFRAVTFSKKMYQKNGENVIFMYKICTDPNLVQNNFVHTFFLYKSEFENATKLQKKFTEPNTENAVTS